MAGAGGDGSLGVGSDRTQDADPAAADDMDASAWPGLESLPPAPPVEYPPPRAFRRRRPPTYGPATLPEPGTVAAAMLETDAPTPPAPTRRRWPLIVSVMALLLLVAGLLVVVGRGRADHTLAGAASTTTTTETASSAPSTSTTSAMAPGGKVADPSTTTTTLTLPPIVVTPDPPLAAAIADVSVFVAEFRRLDFGGPVEGIRLPDAEFEARMREHARRNSAAIVAEGTMLKLYGVIASDADYLNQYLETRASLATAYFDPETKRIVARGEPGSAISKELRVTLAHELTHALDFKKFDLYSRVYDDPGTEQQFGFGALIEGDAQRIEHKWAQAHNGVPSKVTADSYRDVVSSRMAVTYELGEKLVDEIVARGGEAELNTDFNDPPSTSEQIMHPEKYLAREPVVSLDEPTANGRSLWRGVTGEYATGQMLRTVVTPVVADRAAAGWGNDKGVLWVQAPSEGGLTCLRIAYAMDSPADLAELEDAFALWVRAEANRSAYRQADSIVVTTCADVPPPPIDPGRGPSAA